MPQYIIWICCIIIMPLSLTITLEVSHIHTQKQNTETCRDALAFVCTTFGACVHAAGQRNRNWEEERVREYDTKEFVLMSNCSLSLSLCSVLCVKRFGGDNTETSWTRARSTHARHRWHLLIHAHSAGNLVHSSKWEETRDCWRLGR